MMGLAASSRTLTLGIETSCPAGAGHLQTPSASLQTWYASLQTGSARLQPRPAYLQKANANSHFLSANLQIQFARSPPRFSCLQTQLASLQKVFASQQTGNATQQLELDNNLYRRCFMPTFPRTEVQTTALSQLVAAGLVWTGGGLSFHADVRE